MRGPIGAAWAAVMNGSIESLLATQRRDTTSDRWKKPAATVVDATDRGGGTADQWKAPANDIGDRWASPATLDEIAEAVAAPSGGANEIALLAGAWVGLMSTLLLRGGKGMHSLLGVVPCSGAWWALTAGSVIALLALSVLAGRRLVRRSEVLVAGGCARMAGDVSWVPRTAADALFRTLVAGVIAGLMGVGGGVVLGPMMLELGMLPQVSSSTTGMMLLVTSSCAAVGFIAGGVAPLDYALAFGAVTSVAGYSGKRFFSHLVQKYRCASLIVLLLGGMIAASMLAVGATGALDLRRRLADGTQMADVLVFRGLCAA